LATSPQRVYRAACPNCGALVEFASAASASAVCGYCRSTLVRDGEALQRIGVSAELFDDHSPLQLGAAGRYEGVAFTLVGRLQYGWADGTWNEWHALFDNGRSGWLSEDNGAYVFAFDADAPPEAAAAFGLGVGQATRIAGHAWTVASVVRARLIAAQGELPRPPRLDGEFSVIDLRNAQDEVGTLDAADAQRPQWSIGRPVRLADLRLSGLAEGAAEKTLAGRGFPCPNCGAALTVTLNTTQTLTCAQCNAVIDVSQGVGGELAHYQQNNGGVGDSRALIALGSSATLLLGTPAPAPWQVVGCMERCDLPDPGSDDEQSFWREYLLYNREHGFAFLVDSNEDGWSWMRPLTGQPTAQGARMLWRGASYAKRWGYRARVTAVQGEFYWRVRRNEEARVVDYDGTGKDAAKRLSMEKTASEVVWSAGETLDAALVAKAFGLAAPAQAFKRDRLPLAGGMPNLVKSVLILLGFFLLVAVLSMCSGNGCDDYRSQFGENSAEYKQCLNRGGGSSGSSGRIGGGSWGGYSSGSGGHK
jgi:ribosomal protein S27AE